MDDFKMNVSTASSTGGQPSTEHFDPSVVTGKTNFVVLYHFPCTDGIFAALAAHWRLRTFACETTFIPYCHEDKDADKMAIADRQCFHEETIVFFVDCAGTLPLLCKLADKCRQIIVLDHHKTSEDEMKETFDVDGGIVKPKNLLVVMDQDHSGAIIAYDYFGCKVDHPKMRRVFEYVEDRDLWKYQLPFSKAFTFGQRSLNIELDTNINPFVFQQLECTQISKCIQLGVPIIEKNRQVCKSAVQQAFEVDLRGGDGTYLCVWRDDPYKDVGVSDLGNALAKASVNHRGAVVSMVEEEDDDDDNLNKPKKGQRIKFSLRSVGLHDTSATALHYGGGGHRNASGFVLDLASTVLMPDVEKRCELFQEMMAQRMSD